MSTPASTDRQPPLPRDHAAPAMGQASSFGGQGVRSEEIVDAGLTSTAVPGRGVGRPASAAMGGIVVALACIGVAYWPTIAVMVGIWARSDTFAHGFLVPPIVLWLVWRRRAELQRVKLQPALPALGFVALAGVAWLVGEAAHVNALRQFAVVGMIALAVPTIAGIAAARVIAFPLGFLLFAVPFGEFLLPQLMDWTAQFTIAALRATGIPVYQEGLRFVIPSGTWSVVEACSGVRYLIASAMVGTLFAYLTYRSTARRVVFVAVSFLVPIVANWLRAYLIVLLGHLSSNRLAVGVDHLIYGWVFFGIVMFLMFWIGSRWREDDARPATQAAAAVRVASGPSNRPSSFWIATLAFAAVVATPPLLSHSLHDESRAAPQLGAVTALGSWGADAVPVTAWRPHYVAPSAELFQSFGKGGERAALYVAFYRDQTDTRKLVSSDNALVTSDDPQWALTGSAGRMVRLGEREVKVRTADLRAASGERLRVWQWYWVSDKTMGSAVEAKVYTAMAELLGRGDDSATIVLVAPLPASADAQEQADRVLASFAQEAAGPIEGLLRKVR